MKNRIVPLNETLNDGCYYSSTYVSIAIQSGHPAALRMLFQYGAKPHHPDAGTLTIGQDSIFYYKERHANSSSSSSSSESDQNVEDEDEEERHANSSSSSSSSESNQNVEDEENERSSDSSEYSEEFQKTELEEDEQDHPLQCFVKNPYKYWSSGFEEESGAIDDEGEWISNPAHESPPNYNVYYIHQSARGNQIECLDVLLTQYLSLNIPQMVQLCNEYQETPLHVSVLEKAYAAAECLLKWGASVDRGDHWEETPLHNAAYVGDEQLAELLLKYGADPNTPNEVGLSPFHIALTHLNLNLVKLFFKYGGDLSPASFKDLCSNDDEIVVADLLEGILEQRCWDEQRKIEFEKFILKLIRLLNYGWDEGEFTWAEQRPNSDPRLRQAQLDEVENLMTLVEHRAQLSESYPGFDYVDEASELEYAIENGDHEKMEGLTDFILDDPDLIGEVLESAAFSPLKSELLEHWFEIANSTQYENLKKYAEQYQDHEVLNRIEEDKSLLVSESDDSSSLEELPEIVGKVPPQSYQQGLNPSALLTQQGSSALFAQTVRTVLPPVLPSLNQTDQISPQNAYEST